MLRSNVLQKANLKAATAFTNRQRDAILQLKHTRGLAVSVLYSGASVACSLSETLNAWPPDKHTE